MNDQEQQVAHIELTRLQSLVNRDMSVASDLHAEDYQLVSPGGVTLSKHDYLERVASKSLEYLAFEPDSDIEALSADGMVTLRYIARIVLSVGISDEVEFKAWHTETYQKREGRWMAVWSQATTID